MAPVLRLYEDVLPNDGGELALPAMPHMVYVVHGSILIADRPMHRDEAFGGDAATGIKGGPEGATIWRWELVAENSPATVASGPSAISHEKLSVRLDALPKGAAFVAGRQRRVSARRLRLSAPASGTGYPLPARRRHPHRHARALDLIWTGKSMVRERTRAGIRPGHGSADTLYSRHDSSDGLFGEKLGRISSRRRQRQAEDAEVQNLRRHADRGCGSDWITSIARLFDFYVLEPYPTPFAQTVSRLFDPLQKPRIVFEPVIEPCVARIRNQSDDAVRAMALYLDYVAAVGTTDIVGSPSPASPRPILSQALRNSALLY